MSSNPSEIGARIRDARKAAKLNQTQLAERLNKTMRTVQKYESGEIEPSIAVINEIANILHVSPVSLIGYKRPGIQLNSLSDVLAFLYELNRKAGLRFDLDVKKPPESDTWSCSIRFDGNSKEAGYNADLCLILERFADEREKLETYWSDQDYFDHWLETELAYYADTSLMNREIENLTAGERIRRRNALDQKLAEEKKKAADTNGSRGGAD